MRGLKTTLTILLVCVLAVSVVRRLLFPRPSSLQVDGNGMIQHPWYGEYSQKVVFQEGMTLYPGQQALVVEK